MSNIKVSIVVPVYNIPKSILRKCIESCINQSLKEIEIILVDDGSTDNSGLICGEYAKIDKRIKVIHKKNGGLSAARNTGYENAVGEWLMFLDGDDWIDSYACEDTYKLGVESGTDVVIFGTIQEFGHYKNPFKYRYENGKIFEGKKCKELQCEILNFNGNIATAWAKLFNKRFLDENRLEHNVELRQGSEGIEFNIRVFEKVKRVYFTDKIYYHYIYNPNSISAKHDEKNHYFVIKCFEEIKRQIEVSENRDALDKLFYNRFAYVVVAAAISGYFNPNNNLDYRLQKAGFKKYISNNLVKETIHNYQECTIDYKRKFILRLIALNCFFPLRIFAIIRLLQKKGVK